MRDPALMTYEELLALRARVNHLIFLEEHPECKKRIRKERYKKYWLEATPDILEDLDPEACFQRPNENKEYLDKVVQIANDIYDTTGDLDYALDTVSSILGGSRLG